jgi:hypothetical protein
MSANPWSKTLTLATANVAYSLLSLIQAVDPSVKYSQCCKLAIQEDGSMGGAKLRIGNSDISATNCGVSLLASQAQLFEGMDLNLYSLLDIYLMSDTNTCLVNVTFCVH